MPVESILGDLPEGWEVASLGDACKRGGGNVQTGPFGSQLHASDYVPSGIPVVMPVNIGDNRVEADGIARIRTEDAQRLSRHLLQVGDIVYSRRGDVERRALIRPEESGWLCGTGCLRVRFGEGVVSPAFASFQLGHPAVRAWIVRHAVGATMPNLNTGILEAVPFVVPPFSVQLKIAAILAALDDKIALNRRMNQTVEAMARAIFKSWCVGSEMVAGAKKFPSVDVYRIATVTYGAPFTSALFNESGEGRPLIRIRDLVSQSPGVYTTEEHPKGRMVMPGEILVGMDGEFRAKIWCGPPAWLNQRVCCFEPKPGIPRAFLLYSIEEPLAYFERSKTGTTVIHLGKADIDTFRFLLPPPEILRKFDELTSPMLERIVANEQESRTLAALRDALLPKLLSGEIRVKQAEKIVGEVV